MTTRKIVTLLVISLTALCLIGASPKDYPLRPVQLIVPFAAGGGTDIGTRIAVKVAEKYFPKPIVVQNVDGGGSEVGVSQMVRAEPDGYTVAGFNSASITLTTMRKASYNPVTDVSPKVSRGLRPAPLRRARGRHALQDAQGFHPVRPGQP